jgi:hypothetical protein
MTRSYSTAEGIRLRRIDEPEMRKLRRRLLQLGGKFVEPLVNLDGTFDRVSAGLLNRDAFAFGPAYPESATIMSRFSGAGAVTGFWASALAIH